MRNELIDRIMNVSPANLRDAAESRLPKAVCDAAEHYVRSGHADHEHSVLVQRLDALRRSKSLM